MHSPSQLSLRTRAYLCLHCVRWCVFVCAPGSTGSDIDPMDVVTQDIMDESWLICFDEFQVTDIADAMILKRLFTGLIGKGNGQIETVWCGLLDAVVQSCSRRCLCWLLWT